MCDIVQFDVRGTIIKTYKSVLENSDSGCFKDLVSDIMPHDEPRFIDCDPQFFHFMLDCISTKTLPTSNYRPEFLKKMFDLYDIRVFHGHDVMKQHKDLSDRIVNEILSLHKQKKLNKTSMAVEFIKGNHEGNLMFKNNTLTVFTTQAEQQFTILPMIESINMREDFFQTNTVGLKVLSVQSYTFCVVFIIGNIQ